MVLGPIDGGSLPLSDPRGLEPVETATPSLDTTGVPQEVSFGDVFAEVVASANARGHSSRQAAIALAEGRNDDIHGVMIEVQKAGVEMRLVGSIKNKVVDAFYEIWRMNI